jgi:carbonic anhydrase
MEGARLQWTRLTRPSGDNMTTIVDEVLTANLNYSRSFGEKAKLGLPPARRFAILTCMDARLDPAKYAGLSEGDAHVIRNAGGRATDDAIRSLVISYKLLGTREWFVIHHTDCGMELFTDEVIAGLLEQSVQTSVFEQSKWKDIGRGPGSIAGRYIKWHTIRNLEQSVVEDVAQIRAHDLVPDDIPIYGYIYDVRSGRLSEVAGATRAGRAVDAGRRASLSHAAFDEFGLNDG